MKHYNCLSVRCMIVWGLDKAGLGKHWWLTLINHKSYDSIPCNLINWSKLDILMLHFMNILFSHIAHLSWLVLFECHSFFKIAGSSISWSIFYPQLMPLFSKTQIWRNSAYQAAYVEGLGRPHFGLGPFFIVNVWLTDCVFVIYET